MKGGEIMAELRVTPAELRSNGQAVVSTAQELEQLLHKLDSQINTIHEGWSGAAQSGHAAKYAELKPNFKQAQEILLNFGQLTVQTADKFEQVDNELSKF